MFIAYYVFLLFKMCSWILCHSFIQSQIWSRDQIEYGLNSVTCFQITSGSDNVWFQDKKALHFGGKVKWLAHILSLPITPSRSHLLCHGTLKQHYGEADMVRNWGLQSITSKDIRPPANKQVSELSWTLILQTQLSL